MMPSIACFHLFIMIYCAVDAFGIDERLIEQYTTDRLHYIQSVVNISVLVHVHIPKAGGTALALALSSNCSCKVTTFSKDTEPKPTCVRCSKVHSSTFESIYSINRATGWKCGVHPPLSAMEYCLETADSSSNILRKGFTPIYIIMLRDPFSRFVSESLKWTNLRGHAVDWDQHVKVTRTKKPNTENIPPHLDILLQYAEQDDRSFILPNRQVKMIGGKLENFKMNYATTTSAETGNSEGGSRWIQTSTSTTQTSFARAKYVLSKQPNVIFGLQERFEEFLCILELIYGEKYSFAWYPTIHSHNHTALNSVLSSNKHRFLYTTSMTLPSIIPEYDTYRKYEPLMKIWQSHNAADLELYDYAQELFQIQFNTILNHFSHVSKKKIPHCLKYRLPQ